MPTLQHFQPHREILPRRYCEECSALLSSGNLTALCAPCGGTWDAEVDFDAPLPLAIRQSIADAIDRILAMEPA